MIVTMYIIHVHCTPLTRIYIYPVEKSYNLARLIFLFFVFLFEKSVCVSFVGFFSINLLVWYVQITRMLFVCKKN